MNSILPSFFSDARCSNSNGDLLLAAKEANLTAVEFILQHCSDNTDVNSEDSSFYDYTPLIYASRYGHPEVVGLLLQHPQIDVNKGSYNGETALYQASRNGHSEVVQLLLQHPQIQIDINKDDNGQTALHVASSSGQSEVVELLLQHPQIDVNKGDNLGKNALFWASSAGQANVIKLLLNNRDIDMNKKNGDGETALFTASYNGHTEIVKLLLQRPVVDQNIEYKNVTVLWIASDRGHNEIVQLFLEHPETNITKGLPVDDDIIAKISSLIFIENTPFEKETSKVFVAAILGNANEISDLLESTKSNVNSYDSYHSTPLFWASTRGHNNVVKVLLHHADVLVNVGRSGDGANALYQASKYGLMDTVSILLQHPMINVNYETLSKKTSLMIASINGQSEVVKKLLSIVNIDVNHATFDGKTALIYAVMAKQQTILNLLLRCPKANTNLHDEEYMTALGRAREIHATELIAQFSQRGTMQKSEGHTCCSETINRGLHVSIDNGDLSWIMTFRACPGIDINVHNKDGYTPLNLATQKGRKGMVEVLLADQSIDVNKNNTGQRDNAILIASEGGNIEILKSLVLHNQTFVNQGNAKGQSAILMALEKYQKEGERKYFRIVKHLLKCPKIKVPKTTSYGPDIEQVVNLRSMLIEIRPTCCMQVIESLLGAAWVGDFRAIRGLIKCPGSKANVNTVDNEGRTPLYIAAMIGHYEVVDILLKNHDVDANIGRRFNGGTAFSIASEKSHFHVMKSLIVNQKSNLSKGWCISNWAMPCKQITDKSTLTMTPATKTVITSEFH